MTIQKSYMDLPYDMSGAMAKNRFRQEILWGLSKFLDVYSSKEDFTMIFDRVCDIEIHDSENFEFYQVKTKKSGRAFTFSQILKRELTKENPENQLSILGKLYIIKHRFSGTEKIKLGIVSNAPLINKSKEYCYMCEENFCNFTDEIQNICTKLLGEICALDSKASTVIDLNNIFYLHTSMDLQNPSEMLLGKLTNFFHDVQRGDPKKPKALLDVLQATIYDKASYETPSQSYEELVKKKGLTKVEFENILDAYTEKIDLSIEKTISFINEYTEIYAEQEELNFCLARIISDLSYSNLLLKELEKKICEYRKNTIRSFRGKKSEFIKQAVEDNKMKFPIEYSETEITAFIMLVCTREEERMYE